MALSGRPCDLYCELDRHVPTRQPSLTDSDSKQHIPRVRARSPFVMALLQSLEDADERTAESLVDAEDVGSEVFAENHVNMTFFSVCRVRSKPDSSGRVHSFGHPCPDSFFLRCAQLPSNVPYLYTLLRAARRTDGCRARTDNTSLQERHQ